MSYRPQYERILREYGFVAHNEAQFQSGMAKLGLMPNDRSRVVSVGNGAYVLAEKRGEFETGRQSVASRSPRSVWSRVEGVPGYVAPGGWTARKQSGVYILNGPGGYAGAFPTLAEAGRFVELAKSSNRRAAR